MGMKIDEGYKWLPFRRKKKPLKRKTLQWNDEKFEELQRRKARRTPQRAGWPEPS